MDEMGKNEWDDALSYYESSVQEYLELKKEGNNNESYNAVMPTSIHNYSQPRPNTKRST